MAAARILAQRPDGCLWDRLRQPRAGNQHATPRQRRPQPAPSSPSMISAAQASSSFVLAAAPATAAAGLDPGRATRRPGHLQVPKNSEPSPDSRTWPTGQDPYALSAVMACWNTSKNGLPRYRGALACPASCLPRGDRPPGGGADQRVTAQGVNRRPGPGRPDAAGLETGLHGMAGAPGRVPADPGDPGPGGDASPESSSRCQRGWARSRGQPWNIAMDQPCGPG